MNIKIMVGAALVIVVLSGGGYWLMRASAPVTGATSEAETSSVTSPEASVQAEDNTATSAKAVPTATPTATASTANEIVLQGKAVKGIILNAKIRAVEVVNGKMSGIVKEVEIDSSGDYSVSMPIGAILLQVITRKGSIEKDEVLGVDVPLPLDFSFRAAVDLTDETRKSVPVNITAYSEAAVVLAEKNGGLSPLNINQANSGIANILGVDFISTEMIQSTDTARLANATLSEKKMAILNAAISEMASKDKMGCGPRQTYGETINCTIANFADQFSSSGW